MAGPLCTGLVEVWVQFQAKKREDSKTGGRQFGLLEDGKAEMGKLCNGEKGSLKPRLFTNELK